MVKEVEYEKAISFEEKIKHLLNEGDYENVLEEIINEVDKLKKVADMIKLRGKNGH